MKLLHKVIYADSLVLHHGKGAKERSTPGEILQLGLGVVKNGIEIEISPA
jgi:hypothetical protein